MLVYGPLYALCRMRMSFLECLCRMRMSFLECLYENLQCYIQCWSRFLQCYMQCWSRLQRESDSIRLRVSGNIYDEKIEIWESTVLYTMSEPTSKRWRKDWNMRIYSTIYNIGADFEEPTSKRIRLRVSLRREITFCNEKIKLIRWAWDIDECKEKISE